MMGCFKRNYGVVLLKRSEQRGWQLCWRDTATRRYLRRALRAENQSEAIEAAKALNRELSHGAGAIRTIVSGPAKPIREAIKEAVHASSGSERTRADYLRWANRFFDFLESENIRIATWDQVTTELVMQYRLASQEAEARAKEKKPESQNRRIISAVSVEHRIYVLRMTSSYMARIYPQRYGDVLAGLRFRTPKAAPSQSLGEKILSPFQVRTMLNWLKANDPMVYCWACLEGLAGFRMFEAAYLREDDIDFIKGTVRIEKNAAHDPKNLPSHRTVPVPREALDALRAWIDGLKVRHVDGFLFTPTRKRGGRQSKLQECRVGCFSQDRCSHLFGKALEGLKADKDAGFEAPKLFTARRLRASFVSALCESGLDSELLRRYIGHRPQGVMETHYTWIKPERFLDVVRSTEQVFTNPADDRQAAGAEEAKEGA